MSELELLEFSEWKIRSLLSVTCSKVLCLLFSIITFLGCADTSDEADNMSEKCKNIFNSETDFCYDGDVYSKCNGKQYNPLEQGCCVSELFSLANKRCQSNIVETQCGTGWYDAANINLRCQSSVIETKCGTGWYDAANTNLRCQSNIVETKCGTGWYDASNVNLRCWSNAIEAQCGTIWYNFSTEFCQVGTNAVKSLCGIATYTATEYCSNGNKQTYGLTPEIGGRTYKTVVIGTQTWMAENLNYAVEGSMCYDNDENNCNKYGRLYDWTMTMGINASYNTSLYSATDLIRHQGICPDGWHIPSKAEWNVLSPYIHTKYGFKYGFAALPGGKGNLDGDFDDAGDFGYWWSSSEFNANHACNSIMDYISTNGNGATVGSCSRKSYLCSVRCVQD
jgi:uncharacterized protein (TIGR02145 family)